MNSDLGQPGDTFSISDDVVAEAAFRGIEFPKLLQRQLNRFLIERQQDFRVGLHDAAANPFPRFVKLDRNYQKPESAEEVSIGELVVADMEAIDEARRLHEVLTAKEAEGVPSVFEKMLDLIQDDTDRTLSALCQDYVDRICKAIGKDTTLVSSGGQRRNVSVSISFHFQEKGHEDAETFLKYFSSRGWKLHGGVAAFLGELRDEYCPGSSKVEFIFKILLLASLDHFKRIQEPGGPPPGPSAAESLRADLGQLLRANLSEAETTRWEAMLKRVSSLGKQHLDYETVLQCLLLQNEWKQLTTLGFFAEQLATVGDELIIEDYSIAYTPSEKAERRQIWDYTVLTRIEDFFVANAWLKLFGGRTVKAFTLARPVFFQGKLLGDFFVTGTYFEGDEKFVHRDLIGRLNDLLPLLEKEFEYLIRVILSFKFYTYGAEQLWARDEAKILKSVGDEFGLPGNVIWARILATLRPIGRKIADQVKHHANSAAVAQIMNLNIAHSGSHYLHYWEHQLREKADSLRDQKAEYQELFDQIQMVEYIRFRTAFLATATTQPPFISSSAPLVMLNLPSLIKRFLTKSEKGCEVEIGKQLEDEAQEVSVPHGKVGEHAFFSIIENIARNCAKHQEVPEESAARPTLEITIASKSLPNNPDMLRVTISNNASYGGGIKAEELQHQIDNDASHIFDPDTYELRHELLGLKEILICAGFLRGIPYERLHDVQSGRAGAEPKLLELEQTSPSTFASVIYLLKPKEVLVVCRGEDWSRFDSLNKLREQGVDVKGASWLLENIGTSSVRHRFVVFVGPEPRAPFAGRESELPLRVLTFGEGDVAELAELLGKPSVKPLVNFIYAKWLRRLYAPAASLPNIIDVGDSGRLGRTSLPSRGTERARLTANYSEEPIFIDHVDPEGLDSVVGSVDSVVFCHSGKGSMDLLRVSNKHLLSLEVYSSTYSGYETLGKLEDPDRDVKEGSRYELLEGALVKVLVIDERAWTKYGSRDDWHTLHGKGVTVMGPFGEDAGPDNWSELVRREGEGYEVNATAVVNGQSIRVSDYKVLLLHYGMLEKHPDVQATVDKGLKADIIGAIVAAFRNKIEWVFIHSGRGHREFMPKGVKFVEYEVVGPLISPNVFKCVLVQQVMRI